MRAPDVPPKALLLDFYGTLVHEAGGIIAAICDEVRRTAPRAAAVTAGDVSRLWWTGFRERTGRSYGRDFRTQRDIDRAALAVAVRRYGSTADPDALVERQYAYRRRAPLHQDARELLATGVPACVVSNIDRADLDAALAHHGLGGRFVHVVTSEDARAYKPRPEMFAAALDLLGCAPEDVLHVGDSYASDVLGARAVGIPAAWVNRSGRARPDGPPPAHEVTALTGLLPLLT
ncbi:HAD family hydrolase [Streptomyces avicenniae]|uniref:HAD family hydrolase n=1 Tax=Streptomyces avicenniae TaxID=500153 RepID=UPI00069C082E|nr:HAD family hydrolase [Streptomyces avicenniae]